MIRRYRRLRGSRRSIRPDARGASPVFRVSSVVRERLLCVRAAPTRISLARKYENMTNISGMEGELRSKGRTLHVTRLQSKRDPADEEKRTYAACLCK